MAHHNSTPRTVLAAPKPSFGYVVEHLYPSRAMRRHWHTRTGKSGFIPKSRQAPAFNETYVKAAGKP